MNSGAIEFNESKWVSNEHGDPLEVMIWLNDNLEPGYQIFKFNTDKTYFVGESNTLFDSPTNNKEYNVYDIRHNKNTFKLRKTVSTLHV